MGAIRIQVQRKSLAARFEKSDKAGFPENRLSLAQRNRTGNRHRWIGREDQGERVIPR